MSEEDRQLVAEGIALFKTTVAELQAESPKHWRKQWFMVRADMAQTFLTDVERLRAEVARLEAKSKALRAECSDLWEVIERTKDALRDYDGICLEGAQGAWEILQGALDEEPNAS